MSNLDIDDQWIVDALAANQRDSAIYRMLDKIRRQRAALDLLNRRVVNQRFQLRTLNELGRGLSRDEFIAAKAAVENEQVRDLIETPAA
jgi:hypothetical protein